MSAEDGAFGLSLPLRLPLRPFERIALPFVAFENDDYLGVFKPAGMHSLPPSLGRGSGGAPLPVDLLTWLRECRPDQAVAAQEAALSARAALSPAAAAGQPAGGAASCAGRLMRRFKAELGMLSRLDRDTSGLILFARGADAFVRFLEAQKRGFVRKGYRLIVARGGCGLAGSRPLRNARLDDFFSYGERPPGALGRGDARAAAPAGNPGQSKAAVQETEAAQDGGAAIASYFRSYGEKGARVACVAGEFRLKERKALSREIGLTRIKILGETRMEESGGTPGIGALELEAAIGSGFRHQIRAHLAWTGFPVAGDRLYGGVEVSRLYLESHRVEIALPGKDALIFELYGERSR